MGISKKRAVPQAETRIGNTTESSDAALKLFCEKGYYHTSTNEIAREAGVSIGSLYVYFSNKDGLFIEIPEGYNELFNKVSRESMEEMKNHLDQPHVWLRWMIKRFIQVHEQTKALTREMKILSFTNPQIAEIRQTNEQRSKRSIQEYFRKCLIIRCPDPDAAALVAFHTVDSVVHELVFNDPPAEQERIITATVDMLCRYLLTIGEPAPSNQPGGQCRLQ